MSPYFFSEAPKLPKACSRGTDYNNFGISHAVLPHRLCAITGTSPRQARGEPGQRAMSGQRFSGLFFVLERAHDIARKLQCAHLSHGRTAIRAHTATINFDICGKCV